MPGKARRSSDATNAEVVTGGHRNGTTSKAFPGMAVLDNASSRPLPSSTVPDLRRILLSLASSCDEAVSFLAPPRRGYGRPWLLPGAERSGGYHQAQQALVLEYHPATLWRCPPATTLAPCTLLAGMRSGLPGPFLPSRHSHAETGCKAFGAYFQLCRLPTS